MMAEPEPLFRPSPSVLSPCSSGRSTNGSPEFEFWMVRNPSFPQPNLLSADELFSDGVLLPLDHLPPNISSDHPPEEEGEEEEGASEKPSEIVGISGSDQCQPVSNSGPRVSRNVEAGVPEQPAFTSSKRWKDIFKISGDRRSSSKSNNDSAVVDGSCGKGKNGEDKEKKKESKISGGGGNGPGRGVSSAAELNINIWPFSRSRSAGNGGSKPRMVSGSTRKVSSAPCSRSNSASESKSRKWPSSPARSGVHLGRSPVWQVRHHRTPSSGTVLGTTSKNVAASDLPVPAKNTEKPLKKEVTEIRRKLSQAATSSGPTNGGSTKAKVLTLNVPMCIGYRHQLSCRSDENGAVDVVPNAACDEGTGGVDGSGSGSDEGVRGNNLFYIRSLFTKKVH